MVTENIIIKVYFLAKDVMDIFLLNKSLANEYEIPNATMATFVFENIF